MGGKVESVSFPIRGAKAQTVKESPWMPGRELALVKDVGWSGYVPFASTSGGNPPMSTNGSIDLHITETGLSLSHTDRTAFVLSEIGSVEPNVAFTDVKKLRIRKRRFESHYVLTLSYYKGEHQWWNKRGIGKIVLNEFQFAEVSKVLDSILALRGKLDV